MSCMCIFSCLCLFPDSWVRTLLFQSCLRSFEAYNLSCLCSPGYAKEVNYWIEYFLGMIFSYLILLNGFLCHVLQPSGQLNTVFCFFRGGKYSEDDAKEVMVQILSVVSYCHLQGVVHRDLKPEVMNSQCSHLFFSLIVEFKSPETFTSRKHSYLNFGPLLVSRCLKGI